MASVEQKVQRLLSVPQSFVATAEKFPANVDAALALLDDIAGVQQLLNQASTLEHYAKRVKVDTATINHIQYGKLKIEAKLGLLMRAKTAAERGREGGRGNRKARLPDRTAFARDTETKYRKVARHADKIEAYQKHVASKASDQQAAVTDKEMSTAGFLRYVTDKERKAKEDKREDRREADRQRIARMDSPKVAVCLPGKAKPQAATEVPGVMPGAIE